MKRNTIIYIFILIIALSTAGILTYLNVKKPYALKNGNVERAENVSSGTNFNIIPEDIKTVNRILDDIDAGEYDSKAEYYYHELRKLRIYKAIILESDFFDNIKEKVLFDGIIYTKEDIIAIYDEFNLDIDEVEKKLSMYEAIYESLNYSATYRYEVQKIINRASRLMGVSLFSQSQKNEISHKGSEFFRNGDVEIKAFLAVGTERLFSNHICDFMMLISSVLCGLMYAIQIRNSHIKKLNFGKRMVSFDFIYIIASMLMFVMECVIVDWVIGIGKLDMSIQSVSSFKECTLKVSLGLVLALRILMKCILYYVVYLLVSYVFTGGKYLLCGILVAPVVICELFILHGTQFDLINLISPEQILKSNPSYFVLKYCFSIVVLVGMAILLKIGLKRILAAEERKAEQEYFDEVNDRYQQLRMLKHDMNNHLSAALMLLNEGRIEDAKEYLKSLTEAADDLSLTKSTGIRALDMILWNKMALAREKSIELRMQINDEYSEIIQSDYEMCSIFANILDNAIEAVEAGSDKTWIKLVTKRQQNMIFIYCENPYISLDLELENENYVTTKKDKENHGMGLKQIAHIAKKYGGTVKMDTAEGMFKISVLMNRR